MDIVTLDFETYFADDYTLSKMTTEEYVRDPRFKAHCVGTKINAEKAEVAAMLYKPSANAEELQYVRQNAAFLAHHAPFDGLILSHHYNCCPAMWFDTLSMARLLFPHHKSHSLGSLAKLLGLQEKTVPYESFKNVRALPPELYNRVAAGCANDVELTYAIFQKMLPYIPRDELRLIDLTIRLFTEPALRLDRGILEKYLVDTKDQKDQMLAACGVTAKDVGSAEKLAALLKALGVSPPTKISKKTGEVAYAFAKTDQAFKDLLDDPDPRVAALVQTRLGIRSNMVQERAGRMLSMDSRGAMCVYLNYCGAHTLRWSGGDKMNWQNFKRGSVLRNAVLAPPGFVVVVVDEAQLECRVLNWFAGQWDILDKFRNKQDVYSELASMFYGEHVDKSQPAKRGTGKQIELSCGFGAGADSIKNTARLGTYGPPVILTDEQALSARDLYRSTHPKVKDAWGYAGKKVLKDLLTKNADFMWGPLHVYKSRIISPCGGWIDYSNLSHDGENYWQHMKRGRSKTYGGKVVQNVTELMARDILAQAALKVAKKYKIVTLTHDEMVYLAPISEAQEAYEFGVRVMQTSPVWAPELPLEAEGGWAEEYSK